MKKLLVVVLCALGLLLVTVEKEANIALEVKPEITSIKPGFKAL
ncbi:hypothetical protein [Psychrobacillus sp. NPDC093200]